MTLVEIDVEAIAAAVAAKLSQADARTDERRLIGADEAGRLLGVDPRKVLERYLGAPGFPKAIRLIQKDGTRSQPKFVLREILDYIDTMTEAEPERALRRAGRPRKSA